MALIYDGIECSLCNKKINEDERIFATSDFLPSSHPLCKYSDAVFHFDCYIHWDKMHEFANEYSKTFIDSYKNNTFWLEAYSDVDFFITINGDHDFAIVKILLIPIGVYYEVLLNNWSEWLSGILDKNDLCKYERNLLEKLIPILKGSFPTKQELLNLFDWDAINNEVDKLIIERELREEQNLRAINDYNIKLNSYNNNELKCPRCQNRNIRFVDRSPERKSYFICKSCGRSFTLADLEK